MNKFKSLGILFTIILSLVLLNFSGIAVAQEANEPQEGVVVVANVNIFEAVIESQENNVFKINFDLNNYGSGQSDIRYALNLIHVDENDEDQLMDQMVYGDIVNLSTDETLSRSITYKAPEYLNGEFYLLLEVSNSNGMLLAMNDLGFITLNGSNEYVQIKTETCYLSVNDEDLRHGIADGVDVDKEEDLKVHCSVVNNFDVDKVLTPSLDIYHRTLFGEKIRSVYLDEKVSIGAGEEKEVELVLPKEGKPQAYDVRLIFVDNGIVLSNPVILHYVLRGASATIQSFNMDKDSYANGETAIANLYWTGAVDDFEDSRTLQPT